MAKSVKSFLEELEKLKNRFKDSLESIKDIKALEEIKIKFLGRKGELSKIMAVIPNLNDEDKPKAGRAANEIKKI